MDGRRLARLGFQIEIIRDEQRVPIAEAFGPAEAFGFEANKSSTDIFYSTK